MRKVLAVLAVLAGSGAPACALPLAACNATLAADYIRSGGGNYGSAECDAQGELRLDGKIYPVFYYMSSGYGAVTLGVMEPGYAAETQNFDHVIDVSLEGRENNSHAADIADNAEFDLTMSKDDGKVKILSRALKGKCEKLHDDAGKEIRPELAVCSGAGWSLTASPKPRGQ